MLSQRTAHDRAEVGILATEAIQPLELLSGAKRGTAAFGQFQVVRLCRLR